MIDVAILGFGVVGSGVYEVMERNSSHIAVKSMGELRIKYILDVRAFPGQPFEQKIIGDFSIIEQDPEVRIVVETIGGTSVAYDFTKRALSAGKHVVTSNKELVAKHGFELLELATANKVNYMFEASVGGGIPIVRPMIQCMSANEIQEIYGILNGTTNYILTKMVDEGVSLEDALAQAQKLGYAERNPASDIEGHDACRKICILASLAFGHHIYPEQVSVEGILNITPDDVRHAAQVGMEVKLLGRYVRTSPEKLCIYVAPHFVSKNLAISGINDVYNGIVVRGDTVEDVLFCGRGAGKFPTASAVVADVIDAARHIDKTKNTILWEEGGDYIADLRILTSRYYIRASAGLEKAKALFGKLKIISEASGGECAFLTEPLTGFAFEEGLAELRRISNIHSTIRVLE